MPGGRAARLLATVSAVALAAPFVLAGEVSAHGALKSSTPAAGAHLDRVPAEIRLTFNENAERAFTRIRLVSAGRTIAVGPVTIPADSPHVAWVSISEPLSAGVYTVEWQFGGRDGHPVRGSFKFTIAPGAASDATVPVAVAGDSAAAPAQHHVPTSIPVNPAPMTFDAASPLFAFVRWLTFIAVFGIVGAAAFRYAVVGRMSGERDAAGIALLEPSLSRAASIAVAAAMLLVGVAIARLLAQSVAMHGSRDAFDVESVGSMMTMTLWGRAWVLQIVAAIAAGIGAFAIRRGWFRGWAVVAIAGIAVALSLALSGHAAASPKLRGLAVAADTLHVIGAAGWLGSLFHVVAAGITSANRLSPERRGPAVADMVNAFSATALIFAALAASTGVFAAWLHLQRLNALWSSDYGRTLLIKLAALSVVAMTGAYNWLRVRPSLGGELGVRRIRRSASVEIAVAVIVLAITAVLVATATPVMR